MPNKALLTVSMAFAGILGNFSAAFAACTISTTAVSFGTYDVFNLAPRDSTGNVIFRCGSGNKNVNVTLDRGGAASFSSRRMLKGSEALNYNLYLDAARTMVWGDGTGGTQVYSNSNPPNNQNVTVTIFGRIPAGQDVNSGSYTNTVTATINF